eukprot:6178206-Pleurochrysis_carterae.AAC.2
MPHQARQLKFATCPPSCVPLRSTRARQAPCLTVDPTRAAHAATATRHPSGTGRRTQPDG